MPDAAVRYHSINIVHAKQTKKYTHVLSARIHTLRLCVCGHRTCVGADLHTPTLIEKRMTEMSEMAQRFARSPPNAARLFELVQNNTVFPRNLRIYRYAVSSSSGE